MEILLFLLLWVTGFIPVYCTVRIMLIGQRNADNKATLITLTWPIAIPLGLLYLSLVYQWRR